MARKEKRKKKKERHGKKRHKKTLPSEKHQLRRKRLGTPWWDSPSLQAGRVFAIATSPAELSVSYLFIYLFLIKRDLGHIQDSRTKLHYEEIKNVTYAPPAKKKPQNLNTKNPTTPHNRTDRCFATVICFSVTQGQCERIPEPLLFN